MAANKNEISKHFETAMVTMKFMASQATTENNYVS
jgi:hypothetical protein